MSISALFASSAAAPGQSIASYEAREGLWVIRSPLKHCGIPLLSNLTNILCSARHSGQDPTPLLLVICNLGV